MLKVVSLLVILVVVVMGQEYCTDGVGPTTSFDSTVGPISITGSDGNTVTVPKDCDDPGLHDATDQIIHLKAGNSYTLTWGGDTCGNDYMKVGRVWIDFAGEGWTGTDEYTDSMLDSVGPTEDPNAPFVQTTDFTVPAGSSGLVRLRVVVMESPSDVSMVYPCASFPYGGTTDISVQIGGGGGGGSGSGGGGLSGGDVFLIIFFTVVPVYFIAGFLYNSKVKGMQGVEAVPNIGFWKDLPALVKDGVSFTVKKLGQCKNNLSGGGSGGTYDEL